MRNGHHITKTLDLKPPYSGKVAAKEFSPEYKVSEFQKFDGRKRTRESMSPGFSIIWDDMYVT